MHKKGFTLIELVVVIAIIIIMTGVLMVKQNENKAKGIAEANARKVAAHLRLIQNDSLNGKVSNNRIACKTVFNILDNQRYEIYYIDNCGPLESDYDHQTYNLINNARFMTNGSVTYSVPHGRKDASSLDSITVSAGGINVNICVGDSGNITEKIGGC